MTSWYVVHTHANAEEKALGALERQGFVAYLPRYPKLRRHARRCELVWRPLFPRYLFVALDLVAMRWRPILSTPGVCRLIRHGEWPTPVPEGVVEAILAQEREQAFDEVSLATRLREGQSIRITTGPFADLVGRFCGLVDRDRVYVLLDLLGRHVRTTVAAIAVAPA